MTKNNDTLNPERYRHASDHELQVVAPQAAARLRVDTLATENVNRANMAAKPANSLSSFAASSPERVGGVAAANFVIPAKPVDQVLESDASYATDSIIAEVPELEYAAHLDRHDADAAHEAAQAEARALEAVDQAHTASLAEQAATPDERYFKERREADIASPSTPQDGYVEGVADFAAAQRARNEIAAVFKDPSENQYPEAA